MDTQDKKNPGFLRSLSGRLAKLFSKGGGNPVPDYEPAVPVSPAVDFSAETESDSVLEAIGQAVPEPVERPKSVSAPYVPRHRMRRSRGAGSSDIVSLANLSVDEVSKRIQRFVEDHISDEQLGVETMAMRLGMSRTGLYQVMRSYFGMTPANYIMEIRMKAAESMLRSGLSVREVSMRCGFADPKYFSKVFRKNYGELPTNYLARFK